jgi:hypothetical protein
LAAELQDFMATTLLEFALLVDILLTDNCPGGGEPTYSLGSKVHSFSRSFLLFSPFCLFVSAIVTLFPSLWTKQVTCSR